MKIKIVLLLTIYIFIISFLWAENLVPKKEYIKNYKIFYNNLPETIIEIEFLEEAQIPIDIKKEEIKIKEFFVNRNEEKEIYPKNIEILDTYSAENKNSNSRKKNRVYSIVLDSTKSIKSNDFISLKKFIEEFVKEKDKKDIISLYKFDKKLTSIQYFTKSEKKILTKLDSIKLEGKITNLYDAIYKVMHDLYKYTKKNNYEIGGILFFTDGKEESSILNTKDIEDLIIHGTKFEIPLFFIVVGKKPIQSLEKISLKTGGEVFYNQFSPEYILRENDINNNELFIKKIRITYNSSFTLKDWIYTNNFDINSKIYYKELELLNISYTIQNKYIYLFYIFIILTIFSIIGFILYKYLKKQKEKINLDSQTNTKKLDFPEPEIGEVFADLRQYQDKPEKKYIESEEKPTIPLIAQNWIEPSYAPYLDDPEVRKKFSRETMTLSLKEKSYIVLQMALKEAPKYNHAILVKKDREGLGYDKKYDIFLDEVYIGSSTASHIPVRDPAVSQIHAKIKRIDKKYILFDLMSMSGTYLNGKKILRPMPLRHNDEIRMGHTIFRFIGED